jgi:hypothetical protein
VYKYFILLISLFYINNLCAKEYLSNDEYFACIKHFDQFEKKYNLPYKLLYAISMVESGKFNAFYKQVIPWPWAVNQAGKSYYPNSKKEAMELVSNLIIEGKTNIDVGCMQINLGYHGYNFEHLDYIFEPKNNIDYAAKLLVNNFNKYKNWPDAIASYHSYSELGKNYYKKILKMWKLQVNNITYRSEKKIQNNSSSLKNIPEKKISKYPERVKSSLVVK